MGDKNKYEIYYENIKKIFRDAGMDVTDNISSTLYIWVLRKMLEEKACTNPEHMSLLVDLSKVLYRPASIDDIDILNKASAVIEETYNIKNGILKDVLSPYRSEEVAWQNAFLEVIRATADIDIDNEGYYLYAKEFINSASKEPGKHMSRKISSKAVSDVLSTAADIQDGETVLDGTIGFANSAIECVKDKKDVTLLGIDINTDSVQAAILNLILSGVKFDVIQDDFTSMESKVKFDKVVMDIPFGLKTTNELTGHQLQMVNKWMNTDSCKEMESLFMASALDSMKDDGRFVVIVPLGILFKQTKALSTFRRNLVKQGLLKAVVNLPAVYNSTLIFTVMLVFEKNNTDVLYVDATSLIHRERRNEAYITDENKALLKDILENKKVVEGISFTVPNSKVLETGDWSMSKYIDIRKYYRKRAVEDINKELKALYNRLDELNQECNNMKLFS